MKVLRVTRHAAEAIQIAELQELYGSDVEIVERAETVANAAAVKAIIEETSADVLEAVLPLSILADVVHPYSGISIPVIRAKMVRELTSDGSAVFTFSHYEQVIEVKIVTKAL